MRISDWSSDVCSSDLPVMRDCDKKSFAEIEKTLSDLAAKGRDGKLSLEEMSGGTFTITNGGVFGSLMSTPILNMPQSAILGLHKIKERPVAVAGKVEKIGREACRERVWQDV